jgi:hypothetical protein
LWGVGNQGMPLDPDHHWNQEDGARSWRALHHEDYYDE